MGRSRGAIVLGGLPDKVITWLRANPDEELTAADIAVKFTEGEAEPSDVRSGLMRAIECGYIDSHINDRGRRVYVAPAAYRARVPE
jgi:hypothetical protein